MTALACPVNEGEWTTPVSAVEISNTWPAILTDVEREHILEVLQKARGDANQSSELAKKIACEGSGK
jgi:hypothetical protein